MTTIQPRRGTAAQWVQVNPVLAQGEQGYETDTGRTKRGNGATAWVGLPYEGLDVDLLIEEIGNPEGAVNDALIELTNGVLGGGIAGLVKTVDARGNLGVARPVWAGQVQWWINAGENLPINIADGDAVMEVATEPLPWSPSYLPNKIAWFDAQQLGVADGAVVTQWTDLSGKGHHLVQGTPGSQPVIAATKINGHPAVVADGSDDYLTVATSDFNATFTVYAVAGSDVADVSQSKFLFDCGRTAEQGAATTNRGGVYRSLSEQYAMARATTIASSGSNWTVGPKLLRAVFVDQESGNSVLDANGVNVVAGATNGQQSILRRITVFNRTDLSPTAFWGGYLGELIVVQGAVSPENHARIMNYLNARWGLGLSL